MEKFTATALIESSPIGSPAIMNQVFTPMENTTTFVGLIDFINGISTTTNKDFIEYQVESDSYPYYRVSPRTL